nr:hypothetical protein SHINE37_43004 [Rhizobiaceae bacterium]
MLFKKQGPSSTRRDCLLKQMQPNREGRQQILDTLGFRARPALFRTVRDANLGPSLEPFHRLGHDVKAGVPVENLDV